jgi:uncharacterized damage-inducible protein DinB
MTFGNVFSDSFDTFKAFDNINTEKASLTNTNTPKSIWQILNHLITWQEFQLNKLKGVEKQNINELDTWIKEKAVSDHKLLLENIKKFHSQIDQIKLLTNQLTTETKKIEEKLKIVQDLTVHLSFHIGEIILIMRQNGHYPMPNEMKMFLEGK